MNINSKPKVVIIEDDPFLIKYYKARLKKNGFEVICIEDGEGACEKTKEAQPDLIILDIGMPHVDGFRILQDLKKNPETKDTDVFIVTKLAQESDRKTGKILGASEYFVKMEVRLDDIIEQAKKYVSLDRLDSTPTPAKCNNCGKLLISAANFCSWCGLELTK